MGYEDRSMRGFIFLLGLTAVGCASQPSVPPAPSVPPSATAKPADSIDAQRLAAAKNLNMKVIDKDGQQLFCRSNLVTGSHIQRDVTCYTGEQLDHMQAQMERDLNRITTTPSQNQGLPTH
jgi:hypothetical protein